VSERVRAYMWWCGDPVCDCTQPVVERITKRSDGPGYAFERLWEGTFCSRDTEQDPARQWVELIEARARFNAEQGWRDEDVTRPPGATRGEG
jgi:hypothetical protein